MGLNILIYTNNNPVPNAGGISRMVYNHTMLLRSIGHTVLILSFVKIGDVEESNSQFFIPERVDKSCYLNKFVRRHQIDIIVNECAINQDRSELLMNLSGKIKIISILHNAVLNHISNVAYQYEYYLCKKRLNWLFRFSRLFIVRNLVEAIYILKNRNYYRRLLSLSSKVAVVSPSNRFELIKMLGTNSNKIVILNNFITESVKSENGTKKKKQVIWCGRVETRLKRVDVMLRIWAGVCKKHLDWELLIIGEGAIEEMQKYAQKIEAVNVRFIGNTEETDKYYEEASILCHTSVSESFGLVLVEAMQHGVVPIAFDSFPACKDIIDNNCGIKVKAFDINEYISKLNFLMDNNDVLKVKSEECRQKMKRFSFGIANIAWNNVISSML